MIKTKLTKAAKATAKTSLLPEISDTVESAATATTRVIVDIVFMAKVANCSNPLYALCTSWLMPFSVSL